MFLSRILICYKMSSLFPKKSAVHNDHTWCNVKYKWLLKSSEVQFFIEDSDARILTIFFGNWSYKILSGSDFNLVLFKKDMIKSYTCFQEMKQTF